jgi:predicted RNase H-like HicB family nuclease
MQMRQAELDILESLERNGGSATAEEILSGLNGSSPSLSTLRNRLRRLVLQEYVVRFRSQYHLTLIGREHLFDELSWREPESPILAKAKKRKSYVLTVEIERHDEGGYLASCPDLPGCHAEGTTVAEALENLEDAAVLFVKIFPEKHKPIVTRDEYRRGRVLNAELVIPLQA